MAWVKVECSLSLLCRFAAHKSHWDNTGRVDYSPAFFFSFFRKSCSSLIDLIVYTAKRPVSKESAQWNPGQKSVRPGKHCGRVGVAGCFVEGCDMERALKHHFFMKRDPVWRGGGVQKGKDGWFVSQGRERSTGTRAQQSRGWVRSCSHSRSTVLSILF